MVLQNSSECDTMQLGVVPEGFAPRSAPQHPANGWVNTQGAFLTVSGGTDVCL